MGRLDRRLMALEARAPTPERPHEKIDYEVLRQSFLATCDAQESVSRKPKPSGVAGVRYWRGEIAKAEELAKMTPPPVGVDDPSYTALRIASAAESLPGYRFHLQGCEMEVLEAEGFDAFRVAAWRQEHDGYKGIDRQWRGEALPADALAVIDAALAREPEKSGGEHDDTQSTV